MAKKKKKSLLDALFPPKQSQKKVSPAEEQIPPPKDFLDMIAPAAVRFNSDSYILGNSFRAVYAVRSYGASTDELALLRELGCTNGVTLHIYARRLTTPEQDAIIHQATNKNRMNQNTNDLKQAVTASANLQDMEALVRQMNREHEKFFHCAVFSSWPLRIWKG